MVMTVALPAFDTATASGANATVRMGALDTMGAFVHG